MKAIVIHAAKDLRIETRDVEEPTAGQVQIKLEAGGICGSDLHYFNHGGLSVGGFCEERLARSTCLPAPIPMGWPRFPKTGDPSLCLGLLLNQAVDTEITGDAASCTRDQRVPQLSQRKPPLRFRIPCLFRPPSSRPSWSTCRRTRG